MGDLQRILCVEDEASLQAVAKLALESIGMFKVKTCASGEEAIKEAADFAPDLILLDVVMPGMDGPTTLQALREQASLREVPIVFMTGRTSPDEVSFYKSLGARGVIHKPFDPMTLADTVRAIWRS